MSSVRSKEINALLKQGLARCIYPYHEGEAVLPLEQFKLSSKGRPASYCNSCHGKHTGYDLKIKRRNKAKMKPKSMRPPGRKDLKRYEQNMKTWDIYPQVTVLRIP